MMTARSIVCYAFDIGCLTLRISPCKYTFLSAFSILNNPGSRNQ